MEALGSRSSLLTQNSHVPAGTYPPPPPYEVAGVEPFALTWVGVRAKMTGKEAGTLSMTLQQFCEV
jgi:hypothetical protein